MLFILLQSLREGINGAQKTDDSYHFSTPLKHASLLCSLIVFCRTMDPTTWQKHIVNDIRFIDSSSIRGEFKLGSVSGDFLIIKIIYTTIHVCRPYLYEKSTCYEFAIHIRHNSIFGKNDKRHIIRSWVDPVVICGFVGFFFGRKVSVNDGYFQIDNIALEWPLFTTIVDSIKSIQKLSRPECSAATI